MLEKNPAREVLLAGREGATYSNNQFEQDKAFQNSSEGYRLQCLKQSEFEKLHPIGFNSIYVRHDQMWKSFERLGLVAIRFDSLFEVVLAGWFFVECVRDVPTWIYAFSLGRHPFGYQSVFAFLFAVWIYDLCLWIDETW